MDSELSRSRAKEIESLYIPRSMPDAAEPRVSRTIVWTMAMGFR